MRFKLFVFLVFSSSFAIAQSVPKPLSATKFSQSKTENDKIRYSFVTAEYYLENDAIDASQKWLNITKDLINPEIADSTECFVHSLQSELFYYNGLYQFGKDEARKEITTAQKINDRQLVSDGYFFLGINQFELGEYKNAQRSLVLSKKNLPNSKNKKRIRFLIQNEHIYNNLAQLKFKMNEADSAIWYNKKAYGFAKKANSKRGIPNVEQTFGQIYFSQQKLDSAQIYFAKSTASAYKSKYYDIALINYAYLFKCRKDDLTRWQYFDKGILLTQRHIVNLAFRRQYYTMMLAELQGSNPDYVIYLQNKIIEIDAQTEAKGNLYFQKFTEQYIRNEKKLLSLEVLKLKRQKDIVIFQLLISILLIIVLGLVVMYIRRKNKINSTLLNQKNEISKDLHDDIGSGISSILIHSDLLQKNGHADEKQKLLLNKISLTAQEVSQRINTFIWSLNAENNTLRDFVEYVKLYAENLFEGTPLELDFIEDEATNKLFLIDGKTRKNLFFSIKEIFNNALKHSVASKITIRIAVVEKKKLQIEIKDNGVGISGQNYVGNGLKNIQKRVAEMNGSITIESVTGLSTKIFIPLSE